MEMEPAYLIPTICNWLFRSKYCESRYDTILQPAMNLASTLYESMLSS